MREAVVARIRRATAQDATRIAEVHVLSWKSAYRGMMPQAHLDDLDPAARCRDRRAATATERPRGVA